MASDLKDGLIDFGGCKKISESLAMGLRIGFAKPGDILLSHKGTVGEVARLLNPPTDFVMLTPQVTYYRVLDKDSLHPDWLFFAFQSPGFKLMLDQYGKQSTRAYVGITAQSELSVPYRSLYEQINLLEQLWGAEHAITASRERVKDAVALRKKFLEAAIPRG